MSSRAIEHTNHSAQSASQGQSEAHLTVLNRLAVGLSPDAGLVTMLISLLNLAHRGLQPAGLKGGASILLEMMRSRFFPGVAIIPDATAFAQHCCDFLNQLAALEEGRCLALVEELEGQLRRCAASKRSKIRTPEALTAAIGGDALAAGWTREFLNAPENSLSKTQFFTPAWIATYLCEEALVDKLDGSPFSILDPACGAGHLLVQALNVAAADVAAADRPAKLQELLGQSIFGLDVDRELLQLAAFSLYLTARDLLGARAPIELPQPNLFCLKAPLGSLILTGERGTQDRPEGLPTSFDGVIMNPPYLSTRTMDDTTAAFLKEHYPSSSGDLYTAFMQLAMSFLKEGGRLSTIVQQSFLSITRYRAFRLELLQNHTLTACVQLGTGAFPSRPGEKVNNAVITVQKKKARDDDQIAFQRLQGKSDHIDVIASRLSAQSKSTISYGRARSLITSIAGQPFAFHCPQEIASIFSNYPCLADLSADFVLTNGLFTCDNKRFVKSAAELAGLVQESPADYVPYDKGGGQKWYHETDYRLRWVNNGEEIRRFRVERGQSRRLPGEAFYFKPGLTYSYIGTSGFCARLLSEGAIFDIASSALFTERYHLLYMLGWLNSALVAYLLSILNPTINFQIGDLRKLPFKTPSAELENKVAKLAEEAVAIARSLKTSGLSQSAARTASEREQALQAEIDELIFAHYGLSKAAQKAVLSDPWVQKSRRPLG
ncbi:MAG: N-6 DNA methylase [Cyanobacteria bacterium SZAS LIN-3]|nr:N-6 DNA methylase [Cyanobacteria bacterium SZAS LIN-3]